MGESRKEHADVDAIGITAGELAAAIVESSNDAVITKTLDGTILSWNAAAERLYGYRADEVLGQNVAVLVPPYRAGELAPLLARLAAGEHIDHFETVRLRKDGSLVDLSVAISPICNRLGEVVAAASIARDISERKEYERLIEHRALHDSLTELPNRALALDHLRLALARVRRSESFVAVFFLDLDRFKAINDTRGHLVGDRVLRLVGNRLRLAVRPADTVARLGGDEFIIICTDLRHEHEAQVIADRILHALGHPLDVEGGEGEMVVTASIGIALGRAGDQPDDVLREADAAMYKAKARDHLDHSHAELFEGHDR